METDAKYMTLTYLALYMPSNYKLEVERNGTSGFIGRIEDNVHDETLAFFQSFVAKNDAGNITYGVTVSPNANAKFGPVDRLRQTIPPYAWRSGR